MPVLVAAVTLVLATVVVHVSGLYAATLHLVNIGGQIFLAARVGSSCE